MDYVTDADMPKLNNPYQRPKIEYALAFADTSMRGRYADWFEALFKKHRHLVEESEGARAT